VSTNGYRRQIVTTGKKFDVTDQTESLVKVRIEQLQLEASQRCRIVKYEDDHNLP